MKQLKKDLIGIVGKDKADLVLAILRGYMSDPTIVAPVDANRGVGSVRDAVVKARPNKGKGTGISVATEATSARVDDAHKRYVSKKKKDPTRW